MAMRPALKKIVNALKAVPSPIEVNRKEWDKALHGHGKDYPKIDKAIHKFCLKHCIKLHNPIEIKAGTKWKYSTSDSGPCNGFFPEDCKIVGVTGFYYGNQAVFDKSVRLICNSFAHNSEWSIMLSYLDTHILNKIAKEI